MAFCKSQYNEENVDSWLALYHWRLEFANRTEAENEQLGADILDNYIGEKASIAQINISASHAKAVLVARKEMTIGKNSAVFDEARVQIEEIIHKDLFPRFIKDAKIKIDNARSKSLALWCFHIKDIKGVGDFFHFPSMVNEAESRIHQYLASTLMIAFLAVGYFSPNYWWCYIYVCYGYFVRVICGPQLCPSAWFVLFVLHPIVSKYNLLENNLVSATPKRFAQMLGLGVSAAYCALFTFSIYCPTDCSYAYQRVYTGCYDGLLSGMPYIRLHGACVHSPQAICSST
jgi:hypothetical protein